MITFREIPQDPVAAVPNPPSNSTPPPSSPNRGCTYVTSGHHYAIPSPQNAAGQQFDALIQELWRAVQQNMGQYTLLTVDFSRGNVLVAYTDGEGIEHRRVISEESVVNLAARVREVRNSAWGFRPSLSQGNRHSDCGTRVPTLSGMGLSSPSWKELQKPTLRARMGFPHSLEDGHVKEIKGFSELLAQECYVERDRVIRAISEARIGRQRAVVERLEKEKKSLDFIIKSLQNLDRFAVCMAIVSTSRPRRSQTAHSVESYLRGVLSKKKQLAVEGMEEMVIQYATWVSTLSISNPDEHWMEATGLVPVWSIEELLVFLSISPERNIGDALRSRNLPHEGALYQAFASARRKSAVGLNWEDLRGANE